ncbi:hypothetical protein K1719_022382 [Acacia pycnantha]|nr:hypothetical protein K1719_022382 [Acacia pycnantha]
MYIDLHRVQISPCSALLSRVCSALYRSRLALLCSAMYRSRRALLCSTVNRSRLVLLCSPVYRSVYRSLNATLRFGKRLKFPPFFWRNFTLLWACFYGSFTLTANLFLWARSGSIFETLTLGKSLIVVVNEDLMDNHQSELVEELENRKPCTSSNSPSNCC